MKRVLVTAIGGMALLGGPALGADLPNRKGPPPAPIVYAPAFTWTGFYIGLNAGASFGGKNNGLVPVGFNGVPVAAAYVNPFANALYNNNGNNNTNFTGGGQIGYNYQIGAFVMGVEADLNYLGSNKNKNGYGNTVYYGSLGGPAAGGVVGGAGDPYSGYYMFGNNKNNGNYFGTVRGRLGYAIDRALIYVTGGLAYGGNSYKNNSVAFYGQPFAAAVPVGAPSFIYGNGIYGNNNNNNIGYTLGGGVEYAVTNNWTVKLEYLYANFGGNKNNLLTAPATYINAAGAAINLAGTPAHYFSTGKNGNDLSIVRAGVNYKF
jgi:outer membrane immunogenic protein